MTNDSLTTPPSDPTPSPRAATPRTWSQWIWEARHIITVLLLITLAMFAFGEVIYCHLLGFDTYLQIIASRIQSWGDFFDTFREELTNDRIEANFYRPIQNFSIALDYAIWGLNPLGYQISSLLGLALCIVLIYVTARKVLGPDAWLGPAVAALVYGLHPTLINVLPVPCRRSELLVTTFLLLTIIVLPTRREQRVTLRLWIAGILVMFASGAKDIGVMGLGLVFLHQIFFRYRGDFPTNVGRAFLASIPAAIGAGVYLVNRSIVLGGFGGYLEREDNTASYFDRVVDFGRMALIDMFCPWLPTWLPADWLGGWASETAQPSGWLTKFPWYPVGTTALELGTLIFVGLLLVSVLVMIIAAFSKNAERQRAGILIMLGGAWLIPPAIVLGALNWYGPWYAPFPLAGLALLIGGLFHGGLVLLRGRSFAKLFGLIPVVATPIIVVMMLYTSPLWYWYREWQYASVTMKETLDSVDAQVSRAALGDAVVVETTPYYLLDPELEVGRRRLSWVTTITVKGIQAYCEMKYPFKNIRTCYSHRYDCRQAEPNEVLVQVPFVDMRLR